MDASSFTWWLHGYSEITNGAYPTPLQWQIIQDHLNTVFVKVTPDRYPLSAGGLVVSSSPSLHITGCGISTTSWTDPTLPRPDAGITYCGAAQLGSVFLPTGDMPIRVVNLHNVSITC